MTKKLFLASLTIAFISISFFSASAQNAPESKQLPAVSSSPIVQRISGGVVNGKAISLPSPTYPADALAAKIKGHVKVAVVISKDGTISSAKAISGHPLLKNAAVQAANRAKFYRTTLNGQAVEVSGVLVYNFRPSTNRNEGQPPLVGSNIDAVAISNSSTIDSRTPERIRLDKETETMITFVLSTILSAHQYSDKIDEIKEILSEIVKTSPKFKDYSGESESFKNKTFEEQKNLVVKLQETLQIDLDTAEKWQYQMGELLGKMIGQFRTNESDFTPINKEDLHILLTQIGDLTYSAPKNFHPQMLKALKRISQFAENKDLGTKKVQNEIFEIISNSI